MSGSSKPAAWRQQSERSNPVALLVMRWIAVTLGRRVSRLVLHPICLYFTLFGGAIGRASSTYLRQVLGRAPRWRERYRHVHHFAGTLLDRVYLLRGDVGLFDVDVQGSDHFEPVVAQGRGAFLIGAHLGSFEALRALGERRAGLRVAMLMYQQNARMMAATFAAVAPDAKVHVIELGRLDAMLELRDWLDGGGVAGLLADRSLASAEADPDPAGRSHTHWIEFLGRPAAFSDAPFRLAALLRRPVVFMAGLYRGGNRYELRLVPLADFSGARERGPGAQAAQDAAVRDALHRYVQVLQAHCREAPYNWFNFFDFWAGAPAAGQADAHEPAPHVSPAA